MGESFAAYVTVKNQGDKRDTVGVIRVWAAYTTGATGDAEYVMGKLGVGKSRRIKITGLVAPDTNGTYTFRAEADADNAVVEKSEGNNHYGVTYAFGHGYTGKPDFVVTDISFSPSNLTAGASFTTYVTVKNQGEVAGDAGYLDLWLHHTGLVACGDQTADAWTTIGALNVDESRQLVLPGLTAPASAGHYTLRVFADSGCAVEEQSEGNNQPIKTYDIP